MEGEEDKNKNLNAAFNRGSVKTWHKEGIIKKMQRCDRAGRETYLGEKGKSVESRVAKGKAL